MRVGFLDHGYLDFEGVGSTKIGPKEVPYAFMFA